MGENKNLGAGKCLRCGTELTSMGVEQFRTGGTRGRWKFVFGEWAELGEGLLPLEVFVCEMCQAVEFRLPVDAGNRGLFGR